MKTKVMILDWKEISGSAVSDLKRALRSFGLHLGDAEWEYFHKAVSDTYTLYVSTKKAERKQLKKMLHE
jgi:recombination DNA repair RAD52 pathway protein